jgi:serine/threonine-protein kinase
MTDPISRLNAALEGRYLVERQLGEGGMATVYLAEDQRHKRKVALKVLRPELAAVLGADRFVQEIETTAGLQHPHILPLFDSGEAGGFLYYVMPYVEGDTLRDKLERETQLGIEESVRIACEVAEALDYAHRGGVIHRDIKPENVLLQDGRALVADFGIALAVSAAGGGRMTETGLSLGTPHYMSPEQATAERELTARADTYSLGVVLYEMLAGSPPHAGASAQQVIMKIVTEEAAPVTRLRKSVPPNVAAALAQALEKLPADRFESARAFADALRDPSFAAAASGPQRALGGSTGVPGVPFPVTAGLVVVLLALAGWGWLRPASSPTVTRYGLALPPHQAPLFNETPTPLEDGSLVYRGPEAGGGGSAQIWRKPRDRYEAVPIEGSVGVAGFTVSPDGTELLLRGGGQGLRRLSLLGGAALPLQIGRQVAVGRGIGWLDDGSVVFATPDGRLARVPAAGGEATILFSPEDDLSLSVSEVLPDSRGLLLQACRGALREACMVSALDLETLQLRDLVVGRSPVLADAGHLLYWVDGTVFAAPIDLDRLEPTGAGIPVLSGVVEGGFRVARNGTLVMRTSGSQAELHTMVWVDRSGAETPVGDDWTFDPVVSGGNSGWALSPDGSRLAIGLVTASGDDIWVRELDGGRLVRVTLEEGTEGRPRWTLDGESITYVAGQQDVPGLYQRRVDGSGSRTLLFAEIVSEGVWHPAGEWLLLRYGEAGPMPGGRDITGLRPGIDTAAVPLLASRFDESALMPSPDGRWLAYQSDEAGPSNVFVVPFPETDGGKWQISAAGGRGPLWSRDGSELFYVSPDDQMMAVSITTSGGTLVRGEPRALFPIPEAGRGQEPGRFYTQWDVAPDGRFIMTKLLPRDSDGAVIVVENFLEELRERIGG